jgi:hypothetical protein
MEEAENFNQVILDEDEVADLKYAVAAFYRLSQKKQNEQGIKRWGVLAEKLNSMFTDVGGYGNDEDFINRHLDGEFKTEE